MKRGQYLHHLLVIAFVFIFSTSLMAFTFTEKPSFEMIPGTPIAGQANGAVFEAKTIVFEPGSDGTWSMVITDKAFPSPTDILMDCQHITIDLPQMPAVGAKMTKPMEYGKGYFQIKDPDNQSGTTSWNADNAWVIEITGWNIKAWDPEGEMFQQAGTASGKIAVCYKGYGDFKNSWAAGTFKDAAIRYMGEPPASVKDAVGQLAGQSAGSQNPAAAGSPSGGAWKILGKPGDWKNTIAGVVANGKIYTVEKSGILYATDPLTGKWTQIGKPDFTATRFVFSPGNKLFSIEESGSLYSINASDGSWKVVGSAGAWSSTIAGTTGKDSIYTIESSGVLYETDPGTGTWKQIGNAEFSNTKFMFFAHDTLYTIESDGSLYEIKIQDGSWKKIGSPQAWKATIAGTIFNDKLYTVESSGVLYATDLKTGIWTQIGKPDFAATQFIFGVGNKLYTIEANGNLNEISI